MNRDETRTDLYGLISSHVEADDANAAIDAFADAVRAEAAAEQRERDAKEIERAKDAAVHERDAAVFEKLMYLSDVVKVLDTVAAAIREDDLDRYAEAGAMAYQDTAGTPAEQKLGGHIVNLVHAATAAINERDDARAELARLRPVVEAAKVWRAQRPTMTLTWAEGYEPGTLDALTKTKYDLIAAVDALAAQEKGGGSSNG